MVKNSEGAASKPFKIARHVVEPGNRLQFDLPAAQLYTHTPLDMPVEVIHGRRPGPVLLICGAIHGNELNGVEIIRRLRSLATLRHLRGTLVLVPIVNLFGFIHQSRYLPDRRDLNRCFPGSEKGSLGSRVANLFFREIARHSTHIIDLHTGAVHRDNLPQIRADLSVPAVKQMAEAFSIPVIVNAGLLDHSLRCEAGRIGIPVITYEAGEALRLDERSIVAGVRGITNVMRMLAMLPAREVPAGRAAPFIARSTTWVRASADGLFRNISNLGHRVGEGDLLGVITSPFNSEEVMVTSPTEGILIGLNNLPLVNEGEALFHIARFREVEAVEGTIAQHVDDIASDPLYAPETVEDVELGAR